MKPTLDDCAKAFETIFYHSGKFGAYQKRLYLVISLMHMVCSSILSYFKFIPRLEYKEECTEILKPKENETIVFMSRNETATVPVTCISYYSNDKGLERDWTFPEWSYPDFDFDIRDYLFYSQAAGLAVGYLVGSVLADHLGRRRIVFGAFAFTCTSHCISVVSSSWLVFVVNQGLVCCGAGCFMVSSLVLILEYSVHDWRDISICLLPWWLGPSLLSLEAFCIRHWRYLAIVSGLVGLPLLGAYFIILESARWLMCQQRFADAEHTTRALVACNCKPVPELTALFDLSRAYVLKSMHKTRFTFLDIIQTNRLRRGTLAVIYTWLIGSMVYCGLHRRVSHMTNNPYLNNFVMYSTDIVVIFSAILINKCIGRRWCLFLYSMSSGFISLCILVIHVTNGRDINENMIRFIGFFAKLGVTTTLTLVNLVSMEIYPTVIRTMGCAVGFLSGLAGYMLADRFIIYLHPFHYTVPFVVFGVMLCSLAMVSLLFPETMYEPLPDILKCRHRNLCSHDTTRMTDAWT